MLCVSNMFSVVVSAILLSTVTDVQSQYVRHPEIHRSALHKKVIATWDEAKRRCEAEGAAMASPLDEKMLEYMRSSIGINNHTTPYFIGFRATGNPEATFNSVEGVPLDYLPEAAMDMIDQLDPQDGDCLAMGRHNIRVVSCKARLPYICYKNDTSTSTTATPVDVMTNSTSKNTKETDANCSLGYTYLSGSYYKVHNESRSASWDDAQQICSAEGGYLVVINDADEAQVVTQFVFGTNSGGWYWIYIGLRRENNGDWRSVLGDPLNQIYNRWANTFDLFDCGGLDYEGNIDKVNCAWGLYYVCEKQC